MSRARRSIHLLNWAFDPDTFFVPDKTGSGPSDDRFGPFIRDLACANPDLDIRILCWRSALPVAATQNFFPHRAKACFENTPVRFRLDGSLPLGACHHQKMIIIDDEMAFCGGGDIAPDRWDTRQHLDNDPRRQKTAGKWYESRHETMSAVDGNAARALGSLFRARWLRASGESLAEPEVMSEGAEPLWPSELTILARNVQVGLSRTEPEWRTYKEVREAETLHLACIAAAKHCIYMENQYFASPIMAEALAARLEEPNGPEVVLVSTQHSPSWFDQMTMDHTRILFLKRLKSLDRYNRCHAYFPKTAMGRSIIVHSKLTIIDDDLVRVGSANLNNRSTGFDSECDLSVEADPGESGDALRAVIRDFKTRLLSHWLNHPEEHFKKALDEQRMIHRVVKQFDPQGARLHPIHVRPIGAFWELIAAFHLGDPAGPADSWRPWRRRGELERRLKAVAAQIARAGLAPPVDELSSKTV